MKLLWELVLQTFYIKFVPEPTTNWAIWTGADFHRLYNLLQRLYQYNLNHNPICLFSVPERA